MVVIIVTYHDLAEIMPLEVSRYRRHPSSFVIETVNIVGSNFVRAISLCKWVQGFSGPCSRHPSSKDNFDTRGLNRNRAIFTSSPLDLIFLAYWSSLEDMMNIGLAAESGQIYSWLGAWCWCCKRALIRQARMRRRVWLHRFGRCQPRYKYCITICHSHEPSVCEKLRKPVTYIVTVKQSPDYV
jgi:hypothetical protein